MKAKLVLLLAGTLLASSVLSSAQPVITNQPQHQGIIKGGVATFQVGAAGTEPLSYQWQQAYDYMNYANRLGATNYNLVITNVQVSDAANYRVIITNLQGAVTSSAAQLTVWLPPTISSSGQPTNFPSVSLGATVTNRVLAGGSTPLRYQWRHDGVDMPGKTASTLVLSNLVAADSGIYDVVITNIVGSITSSVVSLNVDPTFTQITTGELITDTAGGWNASWVDYDGDGYLDLSIAPKADALRYTTIFHNERNGNFRKITTNAIAQVQVRSYTHVWADYDNDGRPDLFIPNAGSANDLLFHNEGDGVFTRITAVHPIIDGISDYVGAWADYDRDGFLDLFVTAAGCPTTLSLLYRGLGEGGFKKLTLEETGPIISAPNSDYAIWVDVDNDGWPELYRNQGETCASPWSMTNHFYHYDGEGKFYLMDVGELRRGTDGYSGITWADYDNDGFLDAASFAYKGQFRLYKNLAGQGFSNVTAAAFPTTLTNCSVYWSGDYDNDGWQDLVVYPVDSDTYPHLYRNNGDGTFTPRQVGGPTSIRGPGGAWVFMGDYNNDGFLDVLGQYGPGYRHSLFRHNGNTNQWLRVKLDGRASNRSGIGAKVRVFATIGGRTLQQLREISGEGISMDNGLIAHFGLGDATNVTTIRIQWPSGIVQELQDVPANQFLTIVESQGYTGAPPQFSAAIKTAGGVELSFTEPAAGARYLLEASTNLVTWTKLMARTSAGGSYQFVDLKGTNYTRRFYRLQVP